LNADRFFTVFRGNNLFSAVIRRIRILPRFISFIIWMMIRQKVLCFL